MMSTVCGGRFEGNSSKDFATFVTATVQNSHMQTVNKEINIC